MVNPAQAVYFNFNWKGDNNYSAIGSFSYNESKALEGISKSSVVPTKFFQLISVSFFEPAHNLRESLSVGG